MYRLIDGHIRYVCITLAHMSFNYALIICIIPKMYYIMIMICIYNIYSILASMTVDNVEKGENLYLLLISC